MEACGPILNIHTCTPPHRTCSLCRSGGRDVTPPLLLYLKPSFLPLSSVVLLSRKMSGERGVEKWNSKPLILPGQTALSKMAIHGQATINLSTFSHASVSLLSVVHCTIISCCLSKELNNVSVYQVMLCLPLFLERFSMRTIAFFAFLVAESSNTWQGSLLNALGLGWGWNAKGVPGLYRLSMAWRSFIESNIKKI